MVHICNVILLRHGKEWTNAICSNMDTARDDHIKQSKWDRKTNIIYHLYMESKKITKMNLFRQKK